MIPGPRNLITDVPGLLVGNAQDDRLKSGTTVLSSDRIAPAAVRSPACPPHQLGCCP
jgi:D-aminopeptidase